MELASRLCRSLLLVVAVLGLLFGLLRLFFSLAPGESAVDLGRIQATPGLTLRVEEGGLQIVDTHGHAGSLTVTPGWLSDLDWLLWTSMSVLVVLGNVLTRASAAERRQVA